MKKIVNILTHKNEKQGRAKERKEKLFKIQFFI